MPVLQVLSVAVALALLSCSAASAKREQLKGSAFVTIMNGNTLLATDKKGVRFKAFFLNGGVASYEDENGVKDTGSWRLKDGEQVCVTWRKLRDGREECARVYVEGDELTWMGEGVSGEGKLLGGVVPGF